jgi:hypothetical protein
MIRISNQVDSNARFTAYTNTSAYFLPKNSLETKALGRDIVISNSNKEFK